MAEIQLKNPLMANDKEYVMLPYDFTRLTADDLLKIPQQMQFMGYSMVSAPVLSPQYHLFLFARAVEVATEGQVTMTDILRLSAVDAARGQELAFRFFYS